MENEVKTLEERLLNREWKRFDCGVCGRIQGSQMLGVDRYGVRLCKECIELRGVVERFRNKGLKMDDVADRLEKIVEMVRGGWA